MNKYLKKLSNFDKISDFRETKILIWNIKIVPLDNELT